MRRGRKPSPDRSSLKDTPLAALPRCPPHLSRVAQKEWRRLASPMFDAGVLTLADRAALAAYCQAWGRWVEAEEKLRTTPSLIKTPSGHVQQSPLISVANKQLELMGKYMAELGLTPAARRRLDLPVPAGADAQPAMIVERVIVTAVEEVVEESSWDGAGEDASSRVRSGAPKSC
jgi:P27 family predicted phage terminase small subunit